MAIEDTIWELAVADGDHLRRAAEVVDARHRGFLLTERPPDDAVFRLWGQHCDRNRQPDVYARISGELAHVRLDMFPCGKPLTEQALQQAIALLFGEEILELHRRRMRPGRRHGLSDVELERYFALVGNARPVVLIGSERVPAGRAEAVAAQLVKLARGSAEWVETVH